MRKLLVVMLLAALAACSRPSVRLEIQAPATFGEEPGGHELALVTGVVDGDTIEVEVTGRVEQAGVGLAGVGERYDVRLIGIDTPESVKPNSPVECFGKEAAAAAQALLQGRRVRLVKDVEETDRYDRLLRYVYLGDELANARLVINGYAYAYTYPPNVRHADLFRELERRARQGELGLWDSGACDGRR